MRTFSWWQIRSIVMVISVLGLEQAQGQSYTSDQRIERFRLFNSCRPMELIIEDLPSRAREIGLNRMRLQAAAESRLRGARLYTDDYDIANGSYLYVNVNVVGVGFSINPEYNKWLYDPATDSWHVGTTWQTGSTGTYGSNAGFIVQSLHGHMDRFLSTYLRVNATACR